MPGHHIHLGPELGHIEVVQDVDGAEQYLDRLADRQVQIVAFDHDIVLPVGIVRIQAQGVVGTDVSGIGRAEPAVLPRKAKAPLPLLAHDLELGRSFRDRDELVPDEQARRQHGRDAHRGHDGEPPLQLLVLRLVGRPSSLLVAEAEHAIGHEQDDGGENDSGNPERDDDRVIDVAASSRQSASTTTGSASETEPSRPPLEPV